jgi:hypothetical protein
MLTAREINDHTSPRIRCFLARFREAAAPNPDMPDWSAWERLMASRESQSGDPIDAMTIVTDSAYGTLSGSLIALSGETGRMAWRFADGRPGEAAYEPVAL